MGADLLIASVSIKGKPKKEYRQIGIKDDVKVRTERMLEKLNKLKVIDSNEWIDLFDFINGEEVPEDKEVINIAKKVIEKFAVDVDDRDFTFLTYPERTIILSGGMSWGDNPTEGYNVITKFSLLPQWLLDVGGFE